MQPPCLDVVAAIVASQHGAVSADQLRRVEWSRSAVRTAVADGWLRKVAPRVFAVAGCPNTLEHRQMVALLCLGPTAALSHETAARLHGFDRCRADVVEATLPRSSRGRTVPFTVHTTHVLGPHDVVTVDGFRCTSATRTVIDLARMRVSTVRLEAAIDSAVRSGASSPVVIAARLAAMRGRGRWGAPRIDDLLLDAGGHTLLERRFLALMRASGLPRPRTQVVHRAGGRTFARVDFEFIDHGIVVEVSGRRGHASDAERAKDAQRRNELQDIGRRVFEYTYDDVIKRPAFVASTVRARLAA
jgi:hypothetical protein